MIVRAVAVLLFFAITCASSYVAAADQQASGNAKRSTPLGVGDMAPDFTLEDQDGRKVNIFTEWKTRPVVLVFYRGYW